MHTDTALPVLQPCLKSARPKQDQTLGTVFAMFPQGQAQLDKRFE